MNDSIQLNLTRPRKLAEIWVLPVRDGKWDLQLRVIVGDLSPEVAEAVAAEAVREINRAGNAGELEYRHDTLLEPPGARDG